MIENGILKTSKEAGEVFTSNKMDKMPYKAMLAAESSMFFKRKMAKETYLKKAGNEIKTKAKTKMEAGVANGIKKFESKTIGFKESLRFL